MKLFNSLQKIPAFAVAIYDTTIGAEASEDYDLMNKGREWFQKNFVDAYYALLRLIHRGMYALCAYTFP